MRRLAAAVLVAVAIPGCKLPPRQAPPPPDACSVDLARLVASHPRWPELAALDARVRGLRARLGVKLPDSREAQLPLALGAIPDPPTPQTRPEPPAIGDFTRLVDTTVARRSEELTKRGEQVIAEERAGLETSVEAESRQRAAEEGARVAVERDEAIRRYQADITRLHLAIAWMRKAPPYAEQRKRQEQELAVREDELRRLTERRDAEIARVEQETDRKLAETRQREVDAIPEHLRRLADKQREEREIELRTLRQDWQDRIDMAREALAEAPPGAVVPPEGTALAPVGRAAVRIAPSAGLDHAAVEKALSGLLAHRKQLAEALQQETQQRVVGIAARYNLQPRFGAAAKGLPDRTAFFSEQLGQ